MLNFCIEHGEYEYHNTIFMFGIFFLNANFFKKNYLKIYIRERKNTKIDGNMH
jgi:hypothetical protein